MSLIQRATSDHASSRVSNLDSRQPHHILDESEQSKIINDATTHLQQESDQWRHALSLACLGSALASTFCYLFLVQEKHFYGSFLKWHSVYAGSLHLLARWILFQPMYEKEQSNVLLHFGGLLAAALQIPYLKVMTSHIQDRTIIWILVGLNVLTMGAVVCFRVEEETSMKRIHSLKGSTYKHKSV